MTGASRGIGRAAALALAKQDWHVVALARSRKALESLDDEIAAAGGAATLVPMDLKDTEAIFRLGGALFERFGKLDALLAAAARFVEPTTVADAPPETWDEAFAVNVFANQRLIRSMDRLLRAARGSAVFLTCEAAHGRRPFLSAYSASKAALEAMVGAYAQEVGFTGVRVNLYDPGPARTALRAQAFPGEDPAGLTPPEAFVPDLLALLAPGGGRHGERVCAAAPA